MNSIIEHQLDQDMLHYTKYTDPLDWMVDTLLNGEPCPPMEQHPVTGVWTPIKPLIGVSMQNLPRRDYWGAPINYDKATAFYKVTLYESFIQLWSTP